MAKEQFGGHRFSSQVAEAPGRLQAGGDFRGLMDRQAGPLLPLARQRLGGGSPCTAAWDRRPCTPPKKTPRQPELLYIRQGWICPAPRPGPFTGWRTDAQVAQGARVDTFREAHRQPPTSSRLRPLRESWVSILRRLEILGTSWYQEAGENTFLLRR